MASRETAARVFKSTRTDRPAQWFIYHPAMPDYLRISVANPDRLSPDACRLYRTGVEDDLERFGGNMGPFESDMIASLQQMLGCSFGDAWHTTVLWGQQALSDECR